VKTIWKYELPTPTTVLHVPSAFFDPIRVAMQKDVICVWCEVVPSEDPNQRVTFKVYGTGEPIPNGSEYIGSVTMNSYEWHLYMENVIE